MGAGASLRHASASATAATSGLDDANAPGISDAKYMALRADLAQRATEKAHRVLRTTTLGQVNLFFMHSPGYDITDCVNLLCKRGGDQFHRERDDWQKDMTARLRPFEQRLLFGSTHDRVHALVSSLALRTAQHIPHTDATSGVRVFAHSVVEDRYVMLPLVLGPINTAAPTQDQSLAIGLAQMAWAALERDVSVPHSLWVYVRPSDYAWQQHLVDAQYGAEYVALCRQYREGMDREFNTAIGMFARTHHTAVVHVHSINASHHDVADDVLCVVCDRVQRLHHLGLWGRLDEPALANIGSVEYLRERQLHAEFVKTINCSASAPATTDTPAAAVLASVRSADAVAPPPRSTDSSPSSTLRHSTSLTTVRSSGGARRNSASLRPVHPEQGM